MTIMTNAANDSNLKFSDLDNSLSDIKRYVELSSQEGQPIHEVEQHIFEQILKLGNQALGYFLSAQGDGDLGETLTVSSGETYQRLQPRTRGYQSIFGYYTLSRVVYGTYESKKIEVVPLDTRLELPANEHSYLLQDWSQTLSVEVPFKKTMEMLRRIFPSMTMSVDTLEQTTQHFSKHADAYRAEVTDNINDHLDNLTVQEKDALKASLLVLSADGKGIPIKHVNDEPRIESHQKNKGPKPDRKRMAVVGASYIVAPYERTPEDILHALFRGELADTPIRETKQSRPTPIYKSVVANLTQQKNGTVVNATSATFSWLAEQKSCFEGHIEAPPIFLMDGQPSLWSETERQMPNEDRVEILDLLHVISYLWDIAHLFYPGNSPETWSFMKDRLLRILRGEIKKVISGVRQMATKHKLSESKINKLEVACHYFEKNQHRMRYDDYLSQGYPIASGVIEGACRHFVKDRMERAGMQWTIPGAQAMLEVRANKLNGNWDEFVKHRVAAEVSENYPHKNIIGKIEWPMAA